MVILRTLRGSLRNQNWLFSLFWKG